MADEENKPEEILEKEDMEEFPKIEKEEEIPTAILPEKFEGIETPPITEPKKEPEITYTKKKSHRLRNWILGLSAITTLGLIGDYGLQNSVTEVNYLKGDSTEIKLVTTYQPGQGYKNLLGGIKSESSDLYHASAEKANQLWGSTTKAIKLEEKITKAKGFMKDIDYKTVGLGAVVGGSVAYIFTRRKKK